MPRCSQCGKNQRSHAALREHWKQTHPEKYQKKYSNTNNENKLHIHNLLTYWKTTTTKLEQTTRQ